MMKNNLCNLYKMLFALLFASTTAASILSAYLTWLMYTNVTFEDFKSVILFAGVLLTLLFFGLPFIVRLFYGDKE